MSLKTEFDKIISVPSHTWFNEIPGLEQIPNKTIIYKTKTGLGATFSEVLAKRHSIIMLPHVSIIKNKHAKYKAKYKTFAVYGDGQKTKIKDIVLYICSDIKHKKFLATPRGLDKIKAAFSQWGEFGKLQELYNDYFLLIDECHKLCKDTGYRDDMLPPMDDFFIFKGKAMVSATVIPLSDPRFKNQNFQHVKLDPIHSYKNYGNWYDRNDLTSLNESIKNKTLKVVHPYKKDIKLLQVNSITNGLKDFINDNPVYKYCIFFNSIMGIKSLIADLGINAQSRIFCSSESCKLLKLDQLTHSQNYNATDTFDQKDANSLAKYNFFTSSFYTGLDIDLCFKPTIIILTDCYQAEYSIVDPYTDVVQIIGRFRNDMYKEVVHINNYTSFTHPLNDEELDKKINASQIAHSLIGKLLNVPIELDVKEILSEAMTTLYPFATFLDQKGTYSPYKEDNYRDLNRIKGYYDQPYKLVAAYRNSELFNLSVDREIYEKDQLIFLKRSPGKYSPENNKMAAEALQELETIKGTLTYIHYEDFVDQILPVINSAFKKIGFLGIQQFNFRIKPIRRHLMLQDLLQKKKRIPIDLIYSTFQKGQSYSRDSIKKKFQKIYNDLGLEINAKGTDIENYFEVRYKNAAIKGKSKNSYLLVDHKFSGSSEYKRQ